MQQVKEFIQGLFSARLSEMKRELASRLPYRQKFFTADCRWDSRAGILEMIESEKIVSIDESASEATVVTMHSVSFISSGNKTHRLRYHLKAVDDNWLIWLVENECPACNGQGDESCIYCKGKHWLDGQKRQN